MKITGLKISNFLIIRDVELANLDSKLVAFVGNNRKGKTSFIKAITAGLKGETDPNVIREGADKSEIMLDIDGMRVQRTINRHGAQRVKVTTKDGDIKAAPQAFLDGLLSGFSFDPIKFIVLDRGERVKYLRDLFRTKITPEHLRGVVEPQFLEGLDFTKDGLTICAELETMLYPLRRDINKRTTQKKALYEEMVKPLAASRFNPEFTDISARLQAEEQALKNELSDAQLMARQIAGTAELVEKVKAKIKKAKIQKQLLQKDGRFPLTRAIKQLREEKDRLNEEIRELMEKRNAVDADLQAAETMTRAIADIDNEIGIHENTLANLPLEKDNSPDIDALQRKLNDILTLKAANENNRKLLEIHNQAGEILKECNNNKTQSDLLTASIKMLREDIPARLSKEAEFPIPNLRFDGDRVFIGNVSMDNLSTAEQVEISLRIVRELNKNAQLKVLCLDRAEALDDESLAEFQKQIKADEFQYFITIVSHKGQTVPPESLFVEDGKIGV